MTEGSKLPEEFALVPWPHVIYVVDPTMSLGSASCLGDASGIRVNSYGFRVARTD